MDYNANDSISSDDSTSSVGSDSSVRLSEFISRRVEAETDNLQSGWTFQAHSKRGAEMHGRLNSRTYKKAGSESWLRFSEQLIDGEDDCRG